MTGDREAGRDFAKLEELIDESAAEVIDYPDQFTGSSTIGVSKQMARIVVEIAVARAERAWNLPDAFTGRESIVTGELAVLLGDRDENTRTDLINTAAMICAEIERRDEIAARKDDT